MNHLSIDSTQSSGFEIASEGTAPASGSAANGASSSFAKLFEKIHPLQKHGQASESPEAASEAKEAQRQEFAAREALLNPGQSLVAWAISPQLEVLKPDNAGPDGESVLAFAKAQGLPEEVLSWLFRREDSGSTMTEEQAANAQFRGPDLPELSAASPAQGARVAKAFALAADPALAIDPTLAATPSTPTASIQTQESADDAVASTSALASPASGVYSNAQTSSPLALTSIHKAVTSNTSGTPSLEVSPGSVGTAPPATPTKADAPVVAVVSALSILALSDEKGRAANPGSSQSAATSSDAQPVLAPLAKLAGPSVRPLINQATHKSPASPTRQLNQAAEILTLTVDLDADTIEGLSRDKAPDGPSHQPGSTPVAAASTQGNLALARLGLSQTGTASSNAISGGSPSTNVDKAADLSERMGQAIGERMLHALERGQWSIKLMLKPAHLGHVEVEMRMRNGELDASFLATQAGTRELLQAGLGQLRTSLTNAGMDVATMSVADYQNRSSGGESTPKQAQQSAKVQEVETGAESGDGTPQPGIMRSGPDGLDVLV